MPRSTKSVAVAPTGDPDALPLISGITLRWINPDARNRSIHGWKCWTPVLRDSEIGEQVAGHIQASPFRLGLETQDGSYFWRGDMILGYASNEASESLQKRNSAQADRQFSQVLEDHKSRRKVRKMSISRIEADDD